MEIIKNNNNNDLLKTILNKHLIIILNEDNNDDLIKTISNKQLLNREFNKVLFEINNYLKKKKGMNKYLKYGFIGLGSVVVGVSSILLTPIIITGIGFTAGGIAAGSLGASMMSVLGPVGSGSIVALLQSAGVLGVSLFTNVIIGGISVSIFGLSTFIPIIIDDIHTYNNDTYAFKNLDKTVIKVMKILKMIINKNIKID